MGYIYLASPYSHKEPSVRELRYVLVRDLAWRLIHEKDLVVYSPIVHSHDMGLANGGEHTYAFWRRQDEAMIEAAHELWVAMLPGWEQSNGIAEEINTALLEMIPVKYLDPKTLETFNSPPLAA